MSTKERERPEAEGWVDPAAAERGLLLPPVPPGLADAPAFVAAALAEGRVVGLLIEPGAPSAAAQATLVRDAGVAAILVGDVARALALGAEGVQLEAGPAIPAARERGPDLLIGAACGSSRHAAMTAGEEGADYVLFDDIKPAERERLVAWWVELFVLPCAVACPDPAEARVLLAAGADFLLPDAAIWADPVAALAPFRQALAAAPRPTDLSPDRASR